jgi:Glycosyl transferase family 2
MTSDRSLAAAASRLSEFELSPRSVEQTAMGGTPSVAIIVPTFNDSTFLVDALESVRRQTYPHWRCLVVDDASQQPVRPIVEQFAENDTRFVYLRHSRNAGLAAARNTGLRSAHETFVQLLDADDMLTPDALHKRIRVLRAFHDDPTVAGCHGQIVGCTEETTVDDVATWHGEYERRRIDWVESDGECPFVVHSVLLRTVVAKAMGGFDESYVNGAEDWEFWHRILRHGYVFVPWRGIAGAYRQHGASMIRAHTDVYVGRTKDLIDLGASWVDVDEQVAVGPANMPLADARQALRHVTRAAWWAGIRGGHVASVADVVDEEILAFVDGQPMIGTRRHQIVNMARRGLLRGLGLPPGVDAGLPAEAKMQLHTAAAMIADRLLEATVQFRQPAGDARIRNLNMPGPDVAFLAERAPDVPSMSAIAQELTARGLVVAAIDIDYIKVDEGASRAWRQAGMPLLPYNMVSLGRVRPAVVVATHPTHPPTLDLLCTLESSGCHARVIGRTSGSAEGEESTSSYSRFPAESVDGLAELVRSAKTESAGDRERVSGASDHSGV